MRLMAQEEVGVKTNRETPTKIDVYLMKFIWGSRPISAYQKMRAKQGYKDLVKAAFDEPAR